MIIQRKYEWFGELYKKDPLSKAAIDEAFDLSGISETKKEKLFQYNMYHIPAFLNLGCGIPGQCYAAFMKKFEELDKTDPYDNGLTFKDVNKIEFETSRKGTAIQFRLVREAAEMPYRIVGFVSVENKDDKLKIGKCWKMEAPFVIG